mmetsp:Transcript_19860/g.37363  ORF Transcript_19860/g.37363 Transcript_19860/m.37363 type:complete len:227 (+) Transcript_19860:215-895(+)
MFIGKLLSKVRDDIGTVDARRRRRHLFENNVILWRIYSFLASPRSTGWLSSGGGLLLLGGHSGFLRGGFLRGDGFLRRFGFLLRCSLLLVIVIAIFVATRWFRLRLALLLVVRGGGSATAAGGLLFGDALVFVLVVAVVIGIGFVRNVSKGATRRPRRFGNALAWRLLRWLLRWIRGGGRFGLTGCFGSGCSCHGNSNALVWRLGTIADGSSMVSAKVVARLLRAL